MTPSAPNMNSDAFVNTISVLPIWPRRRIGFSSNWWIGSAIAGSVPSFEFTRAGRPRPMAGATLRIRRLRSRSARRGRRAGGPHHVEGARREAEQQEHDQAPRRRPEEAVEKPAEATPGDDAGHELRRHAERAADRGGIGSRRIGTRTSAGRGVALAVELRLEALEPLGEIAVGMSIGTASAPPPVVTAHGENPRAKKAETVPGNPPKPGAP